MGSQARACTVPPSAVPVAPHLGTSWANRAKKLNCFVKITSSEGAGWNRQFYSQRPYFSREGVALMDSVSRLVLTASVSPSTLTLLSCTPSNYRLFILLSHRPPETWPTSDAGVRRSTPWRRRQPPKSASRVDVAVAGPSLPVLKVRRDENTQISFELR